MSLPGSREIPPSRDQQRSKSPGTAPKPRPEAEVTLLRAIKPRFLRVSIYRKIAEGTFPAQFRISTNGAGWKESDINRWIANPVAWRPRSEFDFDDF